MKSEQPLTYIVDIQRFEIAKGMTYSVVHLPNQVGVVNRLNSPFHLNKQLALKSINKFHIPVGTNAWDHPP